MNKENNGWINIKEKLPKTRIKNTALFKVRYCLFMCAIKFAKGFDSLRA